MINGLVIGWSDLLINTDISGLPTIYPYTSCTLVYSGFWMITNRVCYKYALYHQYEKQVEENYHHFYYLEDHPS